MSGPDETLETPPGGGDDAQARPGVGPAPAGGYGAEAVPDEGEGPAIGWVRAIATGIVILVVVFAAAVLGANAILTKSLALTRTAREWLATALVFVVIALAAVVLRWLQARGLI